MATSELEVSAAVYIHLTTDPAITSLITGLYDLNSVPEGAQLDYVVLGDTTCIPSDVFGRQGQELTLTLHLWSDYAGKQRILALHNAIHSRLNRASLSMPNHSLVACMFDNSNILIDNTSGEKLLHFVARYRITTQEIP